MRILHVISNLDGGGAQRQLSYLASEQVAAGHDVHIAYSQPGDRCALDTVRNSGAAMHELAPARRSVILQRLGNHDPVLMLRLSTLIGRLTPDIVQTWLLQAHIAAGLVCLFRNQPWVLREPSSTRAYSPGWKSWLMNFLGRRASAIVSNSGAGNQYWSAKARYARRFVIRNGVRGDSGGSICCSGDLLSGRLILYVGRFSDEKNILRMVGAFIEVAAADESISVILCGAGHLHSPASLVVGESVAAGRIRLPGFRDDVHALMRHASACVSVAHFEGTPNSVLEAMIAGCPLIVSDIPEHREILDETCACMVDQNSVAAIAEGVREVLANPEGAQLRAKNAQQRAAAWSVPEMAHQYERVYRLVLQDTQSPRGSVPQIERS